MTMAPYGGRLVYRVLSSQAAAEALARAADLPQVPLREESVVDLNNLAYGLFSPLEGFLGEEDYQSVLHRQRLASGLPWTIPIILDALEQTAASLEEGQSAALVGPEGKLVGLLHVQERFGYDPRELAQQVFGTTDINHPGVAQVHQMHPVLLAGPVDLITPMPDPFARWNLRPWETRLLFRERGWKTVVAFQTRNPVHRAHEYLIKCAMEMADGVLLHPLVGQTKGDDIPAGVRMRCYEVLLQRYFPRQRIVLSVMPVNMRYAGPREAIFHAIIRRNYGCTHFIVGRDHAGVGNYYGTYDGHRIFDQFDPAELGIVPLRFDHAFYCRACGGMATAKTCPHGAEEHVFLSGTKVRQLLEQGQTLPAEFTRPEVAQLLLDAARQGSRTVETDGEAMPAIPSGLADSSPADEQYTLERLRALGYLPR